jgi:MoaA/NifB/PqqE/SkfB family radical SAM enzyme
LPKPIAKSEALKRLVATSLSIGPLRHAALRWAEDAFRRELIDETDGRRNRQAQIDRFHVTSALLRSISRAIDEGRLSPSCREGLIRSLVENTMLGGKEASNRFLHQHGRRPPRFVTIAPGQRCNLQCEGCYAASDSRHAATLDADIFERVIGEKEDLWGSYFTVVSGGEPFMYRSSGRGLLDIAERHPHEYFLVYTNGTLIDQAMAERIARCGNVSPAISVEGLRAETDTRRGDGVFDKIVNACHNLRDAGVPFGVSLTATTENADWLFSDDVIDFYFNELGAMYGWVFQYMPIGRCWTLEKMPTPEQRVQMFERLWELIRDRELFLIDFWNGGTASSGCISAGRSGGYLYIDWDGNVCPCVFNPYTTHNIAQVYACGGDLNDAVESPFFEAIRRWHDTYVFDREPDEVGNMICQCAIRDHAAMMKEIIEGHDAKPIDDDALEALRDEDYWKGLQVYDQRLAELTGPIWQERYLEPERRRRAGEGGAG